MNNGWSSLVGEKTLQSFTTDVRHPFSTDANGCAIEFDGLCVFAFEDPSDGYRSSCADPLISRGNMYSFGTSPNYVRVPVLVKERETSEFGGLADGIEVIDRRNGKTILVVGTDNSDDYYPSFLCRWTPENIDQSGPA